MKLLWYEKFSAYHFHFYPDKILDDQNSQPKKSVSAHFALLHFAWTHLWHNRHWIISWNDSLQQISQKQDPLPLFCSFLTFGKFFTETKLSQVLHFLSSLFFCRWDIYQLLVRNGTPSFTFLPVGQPSKGGRFLTRSERYVAGALETSSDNYWVCKSELWTGNLSSRPVCALRGDSRRKFMLLEYHW